MRRRLVSSFHFNPVTGKVGKCHATKECPFGKTHYDSESGARAAYENTQVETIFISHKKTPASYGKVFRVGDLEAPSEYFEDLDNIITYMDSFAPEGRTKRRGAIFASPSLTDHMRWVKGGDGKQSKELTVNPDRVYVYPVEIYERASLDQSFGRNAEEIAREYWNSGMTLSEYRSWAEKNNPAPGSWEILIDPKDVVDNRNVSAKRLLSFARDDYELLELKSLLARFKTI